jgi:outer membrane protein TolC
MKKLLYLITLVFTPILASAQSLSLEQCIDLALENSFELKNSNLDAEIAKQIKKEAFTKYFPSVSATGATFRANEYMIDENIDLTRVGQILAGLGMNPVQLGIPSSLPVQMINNGTVGLVSATQPLFTGGQIINGNKLATVGSEVSNLKTTLTENEVISKTENYFWQIVSLKEKLKTLDFADKQLSEYHRTVSAAVNSGLTNRNDLLKIELEQQNVASNRIKVENGIKVYKLMLCNLTGSQTEGFDIIASEFPAITSPSEFYVNTEEGMTGRTENKLLELQLYF